MGMEKNTEPSFSLRFKPVTEGLGLNHFADGLPYAPATSKRKLSTQQLAALAARHMQQAPVGSDSARRMIENFDRDAVQAKSTEAAAQVVEAVELQTAGFIRRILAY